MKCTFITEKIENKNWDLIWSRLGERAGIGPEDMSYMELLTLSPVSQTMWEKINRDEYMIIDLTRLDMELLVVLYARYMKWPHRTFILLSAALENEFRWGYGAGVGELLNGDEVNENHLARLQRDIAFYFGEDKISTVEPVRELLEKFWNRKRVREIDCNIEGINFDSIEKQEENTGEEITKRLKQLMGQGDAKGFQAELRKIAYNKNIDPMDYIIIGRLCKDRGLAASRVAVLEQGNEIWKENSDELIFELIDAYIDSPSIEHREKGLKAVENYFHIKENEEELIWNIEEMTGAITQNRLKSLFNAYISLSRYDVLYYLTNYENKLIEKTGDQKMHILFMRNRAVCLGEKGQNKEALKLYSELYKASANENTLNLIIRTCEKTYKFDIALSLLSALIWLNYGDYKYIERMAEIMLKSSYVYTADNGWQETEELTKKAEKQAVPLLMFLFSFENNQRKRELIYDINKMLDMANSQIVEFFLNNKDQVAYIWSKFKKEYGNKYDLSLVEFLSESYKKIQEDKIRIKEYVSETLEKLF